MRAEQEKRPEERERRRESERSFEGAVKRREAEERDGESRHGDGGGSF